MNSDDPHIVKTVPGENEASPSETIASEAAPPPAGRFTRLFSPKRWREMILVRKTAKEIKKSKLFDSAFYLENYPDVAQSGVDPLFHFIRFGHREKRNPNPLFDTSYYLEKNPDVAEDGINPLIHYYKYGAEEERNPHPEFDTSFYISKNPEVHRSAENPLVHYLQNGATNGLRASQAEDDRTSAVTIKVQNLSKRYAIYSHPTDRLKQILWPGRRKFHHEFWALRNISFEVYRGETVGIVGRNGSGKSTLLQVICGTLNPTAGQIYVQGRVAALLELGSGFNPEFTGRENVFLNGAVLGFESEEIEARFDDIAAFADIGEFLDQPVKTYSSGMNARLAFAVAFNADPDLLVIDEALSVGDEAFARKCFARIQEIKEKGSTILFVSHSAGSVVELCDRAILLDRGERLLTGPPKFVISRYQKMLYAPPEAVKKVRLEILEADKRGPETMIVNEPKPKKESGPETIPLPNQDQQAWFDPNLKPQSTVEWVSRGAVISDAHILDRNHKRVNNLIFGHRYQYCYLVTFHKPAFRVKFGMLIKTITGQELSGQQSAPLGEAIDFVEAGTVLEVKFTFKNIFHPRVPMYFLNAGVLGSVDDAEVYLHRVLDILMFRVLPVKQLIVTSMVDSTDHLKPRITVKSVKK